VDQNPAKENQSIQLSDLNITGMQAFVMIAVISRIPFIMDIPY